MDESGIRRRVDDLGRVVIPADYRRRLGIEVGDELTFSMDGDRLVVQREAARCVLCDSDEELAEFRGRPVCQACMTALAVLAPAGPRDPDAAQRLLVLQDIGDDSTTDPDGDSRGPTQPVSTTAW